MSKTIWAAVITGICSLLAGFAGGARYSQTQSVVVNVNGEQVTVTPEDYQDLMDEVGELKSEVARYKSAASDNSAKENSTATPTPVKQSNYLVHRLEPYSSQQYAKIIDGTMNMGGKKYNSGFKLGASYAVGKAWFNLEGKYSEMSGIIGYEDPGSDDDMNIEFWGDDVILGSITVKARDLPSDFSVNIEGVQKLEIRTSHSDYSTIDFAEVIIK